jgi:hypothetical protein
VALDLQQVPGELISVHIAGCDERNLYARVLTTAARNRAPATA